MSPGKILMYKRASRPPGKKAAPVLHKSRMALEFSIRITPSEFKSSRSMP
jgi:hypothetical protein